jgi:molybdate transport system substrate-binding protein
LTACALGKHNGAMLRTALISLVSLFGTGCGGSEERADPLTVSVAASTRDVVAEIAADFTRQTGVEIQLNAGSSSALANQIIAGAPADLFLSANRQWANEVEQAGLSEASAALLTNKLVIVVPRGNPAQVEVPADLRSERVTKVALAGEQVPAGRYADQALAKLGLLEGLAGEGRLARGQDVRTALAYVERGEAEAGLVYATDAAVSTAVEVVHAFDPALHDEIVYVLVLVKRDPPHPSARQFFDHLQGSAADKFFSDASFQRSPGKDAP